jgi:uncharacterized protein YacL (UPF0231 family)
MSLTKYILQEDLRNRDFTTESYYFHGTTLDKAISIFNQDVLKVSDYNTGWLRTAKSYGKNPFDNSKFHKDFVSLTRSISASMLKGAECFIVLNKDKILHRAKKYQVNPNDELETGNQWYEEKGNWFEEVVKGNITEVSKFSKGVIINTYSIVEYVADSLELQRRGNDYHPTSYTAKDILNKINNLDRAISPLPLLYTATNSRIPLLKSVKEYKNTRQYFNDIVPIIAWYLEEIFGEDIEDLII